MRRIRKSTVRATRAAILSAAFVTAFGPRSDAQTWTGATPGSWSVGANWTGGAAPNSAGATVFVDAGSVQATSVFVNGNFTVGTLDISAGDQVIIDNNRSLSVATQLNTAGTFTVAAASNTTNLFLSGGATLTGGGTIVLGTTGVGAAIISGNGTPVNLNTTIAGQGGILQNGMGFDNRGTISANVSGAILQIDPFNVSNAVLNTGTFMATGGGILQLTGATGGNFNSTGGTLSAQNGSEIRFVSGNNVVGGTYVTSGTGVIAVADGHGASGSDFTLNGNLRVGNNADFTATGTVTNTGAINLNPAANNARLLIGSGLTLNGSGVVNLNQTAAGVAFITGSGTLTNNQTIQGAGNIGGNGIGVTNNGTINATSALLSLVLDPFNVSNAFTNNGTLMAGGGVLVLTGANGGNFDNTNGRIFANTAGQVQLVSSVGINGGTISTSTGGLVLVPDNHSAFVSNMHSTANVQVGNNANLNANGTFTNTGAISLNAAANNSRLVTGGLTLSGGGMVNMSASAGGVAFITGSGTFTNVDNLIRGRGNLAANALAVVNQSAGVIQADVPGATLLLDPSNVGASAFRNQGALRATGGGVLVLTGADGGGFDNTGGSITVQNGSGLVLTSGVGVVGGTIDATGTGTISVVDGQGAGIATLAVSGAVHVGNNAQLNITGTISNSGSINLNAATNNSVVNATSGTTTLTGGGFVNMNMAGQGGTAFITGGGTLVSNNVIRGSGNIGNNALAMINSASITANSGSFTLAIDPPNVGSAAFTNDGTLHANGGVMVLTGANGGGFTNNGRIIAGSTDVQLVGGVSIIGGTFSSSGAGVIRVAPGQSAGLTNVTLGGNITVDNNATLFTGGTFTNSGSINVNAAANGADLNPSNTTMTGGVITLSQSGAGAARITGGGTFTTSGLIQGNGQLGTNGLPVVTSGTVLANDAAGGILIDPPNLGAAAFLNTGTVISNGGLITLTGANGGGFTNSGAGRMIAGSTDTQFVGGASVVGGTFSSSGAGVFRVAPGQNAGLTNVTLEGNITVDNNATLFTGGTLTNSGSINVNAAANGADLNPSNTTITGGMITLSQSGAGAARITGGGTFTTSGLIQGNGQLGTNGLAVVTSGTVLANDAAGGILIDPPNVGPAAFSSSGMMQASNGGALTLTGSNDGGFTQTGLTRVLANSTFNTTGGASTAAATVELQGTWNASNSSGTSITHVRGGGTLNINNNAAVQINANGGTVGTSRVGALSVTTSGRLNLTNHDLAIDYTGASPIAGIRPLLQQGFGGSGSWNGNGITTSSGATASGTTTKTGIGYVEATDIGSPANFSGVPIDDTTVLLRYTLLGDSTMDYSVNINDFARLGANFNLPGNWYNGDYNYDGLTNIGDFALLASNFNKTYVVVSDLPRGGAVPEPTGAILLGAVALFHRRRRD